MVTDCTYLRECTIHSFCNSETIPWLHKGGEGEEGVEEGEEGRRRGGTLPGGSPFCQCCCVSGSPSDHTPHTAQVAPTSQVAVDIHTHTQCETLLHWKKTQLIFQYATKRSLHFVSGSSDAAECWEASR